MRSTGADLNGGRDPLHPYRHGAIAIFAVSQLAARAEAPTLDRSAGLECAGVAKAGADLDGIRESLDSNRDGTVDRRTVSELAVMIAAPAGDRPILSQSAAECREEGTTGGDGRGIADARDRNRSRTVSRGSVAQLTRNIPTP